MPDISGITTVLPIIVLCYLLGMGCKRWTKVNNEDIPLICGIAGGVFGVLIFMFWPEVVAAKNPIDALVIGIVSGLGSTGANQAYWQKKKSAETLADK